MPDFSGVGVHVGYIICSGESVGSGKAVVGIGIRGIMISGVGVNDGISGALGGCSGTKISGTAGASGKSGKYESSSEGAGVALGSYLHSLI